MSANQKVVEAKGTEVATTQSGNVLEMISRAASDPNVDIEKFERLMAMQERLMEREAEAIFNEAMTAAQSEMEPVRANMRNKQTNSRYASYDALDNDLRPIYTKHGFSLSFTTDRAPTTDVVYIVCFVSHNAGYKRKYTADMPADGKGAKGGDVMTKTHAAGSAFSYGQRYLLKLIFNVAENKDDDDGNAASGRNLLEELQKHNALVREHFATLSEIKLKYLIPQWGENEDSYNASAAQEAFEELSHEDQQGLWIATKKGGVFETHERFLLKLSKSEIPGETARGMKYV